MAVPVAVATRSSGLDTIAEDTSSDPSDNSATPLLDNTPPDEPDKPEPDEPDEPEQDDEPDEPEPPKPDPEPPTTGDVTISIGWE